MLKAWHMLGRRVVRGMSAWVLLLAVLIAPAECGNTGTSVAVDDAGNIYVTGTISRWADFDPDAAGELWCGVVDPVELGGNSETWSLAYLAKYAHNGSVQWAVQLSGDGYQSLSDVAVGSDGSLYVVGSTDKGLAFGNAPLNPNVMYAAFLAKVNPVDGSVIGLTQFDNTVVGATGSVGNNIALEIDELGSTVGIVISGWSRPANTNLVDTPFIARYTLEGNLDSVDELGATGYVSISDLAADSSGIYVTGSFRKTLDFGLDENGLLLTMTAADEWISDGFLAKLSYTVDGPAWWGKQFEGVGVAAVASDGNHVYVFAGDHAADNGITTGLEFIAKLDISGNPVWKEAWPNGIAYDIAVRGGCLYLTGTFAGTVDFDLGASTQTLTSTGSRDIFIWKMTDSGDYQWAGQMGGPSGGMLPNNRGAGIAVDHGGSVITTGTFLGRPADFDPGPGTDTLVRLGRGDAFVSKVSPTIEPQSPPMVHQWAFQIGSLDQFADNGQNEYGISYSESGSGWKSVNSAGYMNDYRTHAKGTTGANKAQWVVSGIPNGEYEVFATWKPNSKNASNAPFTVNGSALVQVNQRLAPDTIHLNTTIESGVTSHWKSLGRFDAVDGTITVELSDKANGIVVADAIRVLIYNPLP